MEDGNSYTWGNAGTICLVHNSYKWPAAIVHQARNRLDWQARADGPSNTNGVWGLAGAEELASYRERVSTGDGCSVIIKTGTASHQNSQAPKQHGKVVLKERRKNHEKTEKFIVIRNKENEALLTEYKSNVRGLYIPPPGRRRFAGTLQQIP